MTITRHKALAAGISYGTGCLHFGNDSIVYNRDLRKLPADATYQQLRAALENADLEAAKTDVKKLSELCSKMALSEAFMALKPVQEAIDEDALPAVEELDDFDAEYRRVIDYLEHVA